MKNIQKKIKNKNLKKIFFYIKNNFKNYKKKPKENIKKKLKIIIKI